MNGPYNYVGDGDVGQWVATLDAARKLGAQVVCTGHGPRSSGAVLDDQRAFFEALIEEVGRRMARRSPQEAKGQVEPIRASLRGKPQIARYVGEAGVGWDPFPSQVGKVYQELTGNRARRARAPAASVSASPCPGARARPGLRDRGVGRRPARDARADLDDVGRCRVAAPTGGADVERRPTLLTALAAAALHAAARVSRPTRPPRFSCRSRP